MKRYTVEKDWEVDGMRCVVIANHRSGTRCGYVGINKNHPLHGVNYCDKHPMLKYADLMGEEIGKRGIIPVFTMTFGEESELVSPDCWFDVHGGITYSGGDDYPVENDGLWWFGFDCNHCDDAQDVNLMDKEIREIYEKYMSSLLEYIVVRSQSYVEDECESLAKQLKLLDTQETPDE